MHLGQPEHRQNFAPDNLGTLGAVCPRVSEAIGAFDGPDNTQLTEEDMWPVMQLRQAPKVALTLAHRGSRSSQIPLMRK
jgi:hypothetical protein